MFQDGAGMFQTGTGMFRAGKGMFRVWQSYVPEQFPGTGMFLDDVVSFRFDVATLWAQVRSWNASVSWYRQTAVHCVHYVHIRER